MNYLQVLTWIKICASVQLQIFLIGQSQIFNKWNKQHSLFGYLLLIPTVDFFLTSYRGSPTYVVFTTADPNTAVFGLCTCTSGRFLSTVPLTQILRNTVFSRPKILVKRGPSVEHYEKKPHSTQGSTNNLNIYYFISKSSWLDTTQILIK